MAETKAKKVSQAAYATPDRDNKTDPTPKGSTTLKTTDVPSSETPKTVTPLDAVPGGKHVRFGNEEKEEEGEVSTEQGSGSKRGLVSRRGGRLGSPAPPRPAPVSTDDGPVLEFKTYRSPQRKRDVAATENDTIPSLCSANSGISSVEPSGTLGQDTGAVSEDADQGGAEKRETEVTAAGDADTDGKTDSGRPSSISCNASIDTSPLTSHDVDASPSGAVTRSKGSASTPKSAELVAEKESQAGGRRNVTFSPPTPQSEMIRMDAQKKTPTKSPPGGQFQSLPSLHDAKLSSPCGIFLSPTPPSPSAYASISSVPTLEKKEKRAEQKDGGEEKEEAKPEMQEEKSAKALDQERERSVATPTEFALEFGRGLRPTNSFDASNVLAWLQSPTANGLFSPGGGLGSALNTPGGALTAPRTPRTPTMSTSFFFSDVASLPRNTEFPSPKGEGAAGKRGGVSGPQGVYSSMICISPLESSKRKGTGQPQTPMNYNDVFASPREAGRPGNLPFLGDSPTKGTKSSSHKDGNLDAHMAERDLMEDEDLSVLLQLASHSNTPGGTREGGPHVFRSPRGRYKAVGYPHHHEGYDGNPPGSGLPGLQLPVIGGLGDGSAKLARKPVSSREHGGNNMEDFRPPQLAIRSSSSGGSKEIYLGNSREERHGTTATGKDGKVKSESKAAGKDHPSKSSGKPKKGSRKGMPTAYSIPGAHPPYPHQGAELAYYPLPGTMPGMPPGGSMRVVVGGPPPVPGGRSKGSGNGSSPPRHSGSPSRQHPYPMHPGQGDGSYPRHPAAMPYPHHGHGVYHQPSHMSGMGVPPHYPGHYPPPHHHPSHLPIYSSQLPQASGDGGKRGKIAKSSKSGSKRPSTGPSGKAPGFASKKAKKSPSKSLKKKSKMVAPVLSEPVDRQKSAAAIAAVNAASGGKNDKAAALAAAILRGVTMRPSGKWQAQLYYAGKSRYIGVFDTREKAALAYEIAREKLKSDKIPSDNSAQSLKATEAAVNSARKAAFEGVNEKDPRLASK